ncbi:F0F1 ATP synthase subunit delta [Candidatus Woesebacteria bacterium]|nr:F0F1 ATP synthase subunit delta [Candidatus Woesebacteria bacterium]
MTKQEPIITVTTAYKLSPKQIASITELVEQKIGAVQVTQVVDESVVGGIKITMGGQEFDATIAGKLEKLESQLQQVVITTAVPVTDAQRKIIKEKIESKMGPQTFEEIVDPSVVGGIKILIGSKEYDGTVKGKLQRLEQLMLQNI